MSSSPFSASIISTAALYILRIFRTPAVEPGGPVQGTKNRTGTPQGGVISPLLANIVLDALDKKGAELKKLYNAGWSATPTTSSYSRATSETRY